MARAEYSIRGGTTDADRLARQASVMDAATIEFLTAAGARPGASFLESGAETAS